MRGHFSQRGPGSRQPTRSGDRRCRCAKPAGSAQGKDAGCRTATSPRPHSLGAPGIRGAQLVAGRKQGPTGTTKRRGTTEVPRPATVLHSTGMAGWASCPTAGGERCSGSARCRAPQQPRQEQRWSKHPPSARGLSQAGMESGHRAAPHLLPISRDKQKGLSVTTYSGSKSLWGQSSEVEGKAAARHMARSCPRRAEPSTLPVSEPWSQPRVRSFSEDDTASPVHPAHRDLLSTGPSRMISAAPPKQTFTPGYRSTSPAEPSRALPPLPNNSCPGRRLMVPLGTAQFIPPSPKEMPMHCTASTDPEAFPASGTAGGQEPAALPHAPTARRGEEPSSQDAILHPRHETP